MRPVFLRQLTRSVVMLVAVTAVAGLVYPMLVTGLSLLFFSHQAEGSLVYRQGKLIGSSLIGQSFTNSKGVPLSQYFQPRPSDTSPGAYNATASASSNLGPSNPLLVGFIAGVNTYRSDGSVAPTNPFATPGDARCVPTDPDGDPITVVDPPPSQRYARNPDGSYVCYADTIPERAIAYREFNGMSANASVPIDAVTASGSGLDPDISVANALDQVNRVARARHESVNRIDALVRHYTQARQLGFLGEETVNVLELNLALGRSR